MKEPLFAIYLLICLGTPVFSQQIKDKVIESNYHVMVGTAIAIQWFQNTNKSGSVILEIPVYRYGHLGIQYSKVFESSNRYYDDSDPIVSGSYDVGVYGKFFLYGRFTGRKSGFYFAPDFRFGVRKYLQYQYNPQAPNSYNLVIQKDRTSKYMVAWGIQWRFGKHAILDLSAPFGFEHNKYDSKLTSYGTLIENSENNIVLLPTFLLGIAF